MELTAECQQCIDDALTLYDFMSMAMNQIYLLNNNSVELDNGINCNIKLQCFIEDVKTGLFDSESGDFFIFPEVKQVLKELIKEIDYFEDKDDKSSALVLYAILRGIDSKFMYNSNHSELGPLNTNLDLKFILYRNLSPTLINPFIDFSGKKRVVSSAVCESFDNYFFIDRDAWGTGKAIPFGIIVDSPLDTGLKIPDYRPIRIGISLFCSDKNFDFVSDVTKDLTIDYSSKAQDRFIKMADRILDKAINNNCDFLVLPEYHTSQEVLDHIEKYLNHAFESGRNTPILTLAGSQWTDDNSNQMTILGKDGKKLGLYNKYSPYVGEVKTSELTNRSGQPWAIDKLEVTEKLNNRDKNLVFFGINNVGVILPSICRDAYDNDYTQVLVQKLHPLFVLISAWSPSLNSFRTPLKNLCCSYFVSSVFDNACSAIAKDRTDVGYCNTVCKHDTVLDELSAEINRPFVACSHCDSGCLHIAEYNFGHHVENGKPDGHFEDPTLNIHCFVIE